jgi:hypothetical protein
MTPPIRSDDSRRPNFDLRRLPSPWQYIFAVAIMAPIVCLAWYVGKHRPRPAWVEEWLIPILAWCYIALGAWWVVRRLFQRRLTKKNEARLRKESRESNKGTPPES